ncbi:hypothetical protein LSH36_1190g00011 [Paralvinella palmiformis]|uniref:Riboflavin transporter n=1 Tax=Paralvinella palmiformis TaxID=53620 RepID=A0AAD9IU31_9ANNE|nr:hypothetical protein LSH36_1190g00011 [Paralvinella palmiformis]
MSLRNDLAEVSIPVYLAVVFFAISAWIDINGLFVEVPLIVNVMPEGWSLFAYLALVVQVANIGPIAYMIWKKAFPGSVKEWQMAYVIIGIGALVCLLRAFIWQETTIINGQPHSTALFVLVSFLALVDCTSSVVYLPYMGQYKPQYMTSYYIGEGLGSMIPGLVGLIQGVQSEPLCVNVSFTSTNATTGENATTYRTVPEYPDPLFSVQAFFLFLFSTMLVSGISFTLLHFHPFCKSQRITPSRIYDVSTKSDHSDNVKSQPDSSGQTSSDKKFYEEPELKSSTSDDGRSKRLNNAQFVYVLVLTGLLNALLNGVLPSTQAYTCLPYGSLAFTLAVRLATVAIPLACFLALFVNTNSLVIVSVLSAVATGLSGWHLYLAAMSPYPPLKDTLAGTILVIITQVTSIASIAYARVSTASIMNEHGGSGSLLWLGGATQIGSFVGAIVTFIFVNVLHVFQSEQPCAE